MAMKLSIINLSLLLCVLLIGSKTIDIWSSNNSPTLKTEEKVSSQPIKPIKAKYIPSETQYENIVRDNVFSKERREYVPIVEEKEEEAQTVVTQSNIKGRNVTLYGIIMMDDYASALVSNLDRKAGEKPHVWIKKGETIGGMTVNEIRPDSIILKEGSIKYKIVLNDENKSKTRSVEKKVESPKIVTTTSVPKSKPKAIQKDQASDDEYETVNTPFGEFKRRKMK